MDIEEIRGRSGHRRFARVGPAIQGGDPNYVPPLLMDFLRNLGPRNPFFEHAEAAFFVARHKGRDVGRIAATWDHLHQKTHNDDCGFFGFFECIDDGEVAHALVQRATSWLRDRGARRLRGPINLSLNHECGLLVEGFDTLPAIMMPHNPPHYEGLLLGEGLKPLRDLLAYAADRNALDFDRLKKLANRARQRRNIQIRTIRMKHFFEELEAFRIIYNEAWKENWGFVPATKKEFAFLAESLKLIINPKLALVAEIDGEAAGFAVTIPDINPVIQAIGGRLFPFGALRFPFLMKKLDKIRLPILGVVKQYRSAGLEGILISETIAAAYETGYRYCECSWVLEDNKMMCRSLEAIGASPYKRYRLYEKPIGEPGG